MSIVTLTPEQEAQAIELHESSIVILAHDHLFGLEDARAMRQGGVTAKTLKLTVDGIEWDEDGRRVDIPEFEGYAKRALITLDKAFCLAETHPDEVTIIRTVDDIISAKRDGKVGLVIGLEGPRPIEGKLELLRDFRRLGLRDIQMTWAAPNQLITDGKLNDFGFEVVREANRLGILIDLSHLPDEAYYQVIEASKKPTIMSHAATRAVTGYGDTMTDEKIQALASKGGIVAMHFVSGDYIKPTRNGVQAVMDDFIDHIDHLRSLVGIEHVALGGDYFPFTPEDDWKYVKELDHISLMPNVTRGLIKRGYSDKETKLVLGENLLRLYREVWV